ncbi:MAG: hypothetical protein AB1529_03000 [Candidatus Micrarchaeota archaeon]
MTGPAQRRPERETEQDRTLRVVRDALMDIANALSPIRSPIPPSQARRLMEQSERLAEAAERLKEVARQLGQQPTQLSPVPQRAQPPAPTQQPRPAPRMTQATVYEVTLGNRTYQVALPDPLPTRPNGRVDEVAARAILHDLLLNNKLVESGGQVVYAQVTRVGRDAESAAFNSGAPNQRLDIFRDDYVGRTYTNGQYVERPDIRIAMAPQQGRRTRNP